MLTLRQAAEKYNVNYRQLFSWIQMGWVEATEARGTGVARYIGEEELAVVERMADLVHAGVAASMAAVVARGHEAPLRDLSRAVDKCLVAAGRKPLGVSGG